MNKPNKIILLISIALVTVAFILIAIPNSKASDNLAMVSVFEPDEGIIRVPKAMISLKESFKLFVAKFIFYEYYFYGFPFFAPSALVLFPVQWAGQIDNTPLIMLTLRQMISVLPMMISILVLVKLQDGFRTYRSIILTLVLIFIPAVVRNGFWWHPDGLVLLFSTLVIYFLWKDDRHFGWRFLLAAALCGLLTATKLVGVYFFLAVGMTLIWGLIEKKLTWKKAVWISLLFIVIMIGAFIISNPFVLSKNTRIWYFGILKNQSDWLSTGYQIRYEKGLIASWPTMHEFYGEAIFLLSVIGVTVWGIIKSNRRFLYALTLAWFIPLTFTLLTFSHFKYQYWIPVAIPLISNIIWILPEKWKNLRWSRSQWILRVLLLVIFSFQFILFTSQSIKMIIERSFRKENSPSIAFYDQAVEVLAPVFPNNIHIYYDYRLYVPETEGWTKDTYFELLNYQYIEENDFQILLLLEQRILDYLNPNAVGNEPESYALGQAFYRDADNGTIKGYHLLYRDETALIYVQDSICLEYFEPSMCQ
ncbi:MAG: hypothetical protein MUO40_03275 [Anaerolineaceae bacterium]|nr:hypothetical protein [Anaerolineaceae bacterium]